MKAMLAKNWNSKTPIPAYIKDAGFAFEQKLDGHRVLLNIQNGKVTAFGRNGQISQHNPMIQKEDWLHNFKALKEKHVILDGELIDEVFHVFDAPIVEGIITPQSSHISRKYAVDALFNHINFNEHLQLVDTARTQEEKTRLLVDCHKKGAEGVMIKETSAPYVEGKTPNMLKVKFTKSADVVITRTNVDGKTNAHLGVYNPSGELVEVGRCSLIGKEDVETGDVVEVKYLFVSEKTRLVQPRIKFKRHDKKAHECTLDQFPAQNTKLVV